MPDNWSFVIAAYGLAALGLGGYWRFLRRRERELERQASGVAAAGRGRPSRPPGEGLPRAAGPRPEARAVTPKRSSP